MEHLDFQGKPDSGLYLGVELETQVEGDLNDKSEAWAKATSGFAILKEDGSIGKGFEIVTAPCSLDLHASKWTALLGDSALTQDLKSWHSSGECCGMHVHVSRAPISPLTLGKLLVFINSPKTSENISAIAGRDSAQWAKRVEKKLTHATYRCVNCDALRKDPSGKRCARCKSSGYGRREHEGRYQAINLSNTDTIEFRIFRGTLKLEHVLANIQFVDAVIRWAMQCSIQECESWTSFWAYVVKHGKTYKQLVSYMARR